MERKHALEKVFKNITSDTSIYKYNAIAYHFFFKQLVKFCSLQQKTVAEPELTGIEPLNGAWSPWSTLATPCFKLKTGQEVDCGGGVQYRYRSCSFPYPRFGGRVCPGKDYEEKPCNTHACACKQSQYIGHMVIWVHLFHYYHMLYNNALCTYAVFM